MNWENRYFVREFTTKIPPQETVDRITGIVNYIPSQVSDNDHFWVLLTPEHQHIKKWLVDNVHYHDIGVNKHMQTENFGHLIQAPYILHCAFNCVKKDVKEFDFQVRNAFFGAGALICEIVHSGLDSTVIGCTHGFHSDNKEEKRLEYKKILGDAFPRLSGLDLDPSVTVGFGYGVPENVNARVLENEHGHKWYSYKTAHKSPNLVTN
jgi:hypothetical protein